MFAIYREAPFYDNRDGLAGSTVAQLPGYVYETVALALRKVPSTYDKDGAPEEECSYFVADTSDPYRRAILPPAPAFAIDGDCPF